MKSIFASKYELELHIFLFYFRKIKQKKKVEKEDIKSSRVKQILDKI